MRITYSPNRPVNILLTENDASGITSVVNLIIIPDIVNGLRPAGYIHHVHTEKSSRGKGLALNLVREAIRLAKRQDCYKVFLICDKEVAGLYKKAGMTEHQIGMDIRLETSGILPGRFSDYPGR